MTTTEPSAPAVLREAAEAHGQAGRAFAAASASLHSLAVSAEAARVAVDTTSNAFIRAEAALIRAAEALEASSALSAKGRDTTRPFVPISSARSVLWAVAVTG